MDTIILIDGCILLSDMETGLAEKESQNCWRVLSGTISTQLYLVANFLWVESAFIGIDRDYGDVGVDFADNEAVLSLIEVGVLFTHTIPALGKFCRHLKCGDCSIELTIWLPANPSDLMKS